MRCGRRSRLAPIKPGPDQLIRGLPERNSVTLATSGLPMASTVRHFLCEATGVNCTDPRCKRTFCMMEQEAKASTKIASITSGALVTTLAMQIAREVIRQAIKTKGLNRKEWPAARITQVAKTLLDSQDPDGKIITTARRMNKGVAGLL